MILAFLRCFPAFCALEAQLQEAASARIIAEDNARLWRAKCDAAELDRDKARAENSYLFKSIADWQAISAGHLPIFNVVPTPPPSAESDEMHPLPGRRLAREVQEEIIAKRRKDAKDRYQAYAAQALEPDVAPV